MRKSQGFGCYSPLKKRPGVPPSEFFRTSHSSRNKSQTELSLKPKMLAALCYGHYDGRSNIDVKI